MQYELTDGACRALQQATRWRIPEVPDQLAAPAVLLGLLAESECRAALVLARHGIDAAAVHQQWPALEPAPEPWANEFCRWLAQTGTLGTAACAADVVASLAAAAQRMEPYAPLRPLATEHLLLGLVAASHTTAAWLKQQGINPDLLEADICRHYGHQKGPLDYESESPKPVESLPIEDPIPDEPPTGDALPMFANPAPVPARNLSTLRILDAEANRAREGLRVIEDYVRFVLDDRHLTNQFKQLRHELTAALSSVPMTQRLAARETQADVGTALTSAAEYERADAANVLAANFARLQESLRSLEEYGKVLNPELATRCERIRYRTYTLQRSVESTQDSADRLAHARLYLLIDGGRSPEHMQRMASTLVAAGTHIIQLRDKRLDDRALVERGRLLRQITVKTNTLFIVNDRPDLALLVGADGVHVGQEELTVKDARSIVGPDALVGVSVHSLAQARQAVLDGASYIGVGPVFPSGTKQFEHFPGLQLVRQIAHEIRLPAFAIGGITSENLSQVVAAGLQRVAVSGAVTEAAEPVTVVRHMLRTLGAAPLSA